MRKHPVLIFLLTILITCASVVAFIQSSSFARVVKRVVARHMPADLGIEGDFSELSVRLFPPGISLRNPSIRLRSKNVLDLPAESRVDAERIDLHFLPFQMLSGNIRIHKVAIVRGDVQLAFDKAAHKKEPNRIKFSWEELVNIRAESVALQETRVRLRLPDAKFAADFMAKSIEISLSEARDSRLARKIKDQLSGRSERSYDIDIDLAEIETELPGAWATRWNIPKSLDSIRMSGKLSQAGLEVHGLSIGRMGGEILSKGKISGDFLDPKRLLIDADVEAKVDLAKALEFVSGRKNTNEPPRGMVAFSGKLRGDLLRAEETLRAQGSLSGRSLKYRSYQADALELLGSWSSASNGGEIAVSKLTIASELRPRQGGRQPGSGGRVEFGAFKFRLGTTHFLKEPVQVPVSLQQAHVHWLGAGVLEQIYPLDLRISGPSQLTFVPATEKTGWELQAKVDLKAENLQLDNQRLGQTKALARILRIPRFQVKGGVAISSRSIRPQALSVSFNKTHLDIGGKVDFETGWDLKGEGPALLQDIGEIAENAIRGEGRLAVHVHGPASEVKIHFDLDAKDAYYLKLNLGQVKGRITWDSGPKHLLLSDLDLQQGRTKYRLGGILKLDESNSMNLDVDVRSGDIGDFIRVFDELTAGLWWYPRSLTGEFSGKMRVTGGIGMDRMLVDAQVKGPNWDYLGERFRSVALVGGYDKGKYYIESLSAVKKTGTLQGKISFDSRSRFDWDFRTDNLSMSDLDHVARLDVPIRGKIRAVSHGSGILGAIESQTTATLSEVVVRGVGMNPSELFIKSAGGVAEVKGTALGGQGVLDAVYDSNLGGASTIKSELRHLDFSPILLLLNPRTIQDRALTGLVSGTVDLRFRSGEIERASGNMALDDYVLAKSGTRFALAKPVKFKIQDGSFDLESLAIRGNSGEASLQLKGRQGKLSGKVTGELDVSIVEFITSSVSQALGTAALDVNIAGELKAPVIDGTATLGGAVIRVPAVESAFENVMGKIILKQNVVTVSGFEADLASGKVLASGKIDLFADRYPSIALDATITGSKLKVYPFQVAKVRGKIGVRGDSPPYLVGGKIHVDSAISREKMLNQSQGRILKSANYTPPATPLAGGDYPLFKLNLQVDAPSNVIIQNELFDAELRGNLVIVNTLEAPRLLGTAEVVQGKLTFKDRVFQIQSGTVEFDNPAVINPRYNLAAITELNNKKIQLYASGRVQDNPKIDLSSNPVMAESEILSLLALGISNEDAMRLRNVDRSAYEQGEAASLLLHSLDFNRDVKNKTGLQIGIDEAVNDQATSSVFRPRNDLDTAVAPKIVVRRQIGKQLDLSVGSTVGVGSNNQKQVNAEITVVPGLSLIGVWEDFQGLDTKDDRRSYGVDLKVQKRFK